MLATISAYYLWWILALLLIGGEVLLPGYFLLWIGFAAAVMGGVMLVAPGLGLLPQALIFALLAFASCMLYWKLVRPRLDRADPADAGLNRRGHRMLGQHYVLAEAIINGRGKAKVGDGLWLAEGPDLPIGASVEVVAVDGTTLKVRAVAAV